jgi:hypothetical protein
VLPASSYVGPALACRGSVSTLDNSIPRERRLDLTRAPPRARARWHSDPRDFENEPRRIKRAYH